MTWTEDKLIACYQQIDLDENCVLQHKIQKQICAKKQSSFKRKTVWGLCAASAAAAVLLMLWQFMPHSPTYLPDPGEFTQMQFVFYRELALPGQDLGISLDDFSQTAPTTRS